MTKDRRASVLELGERLSQAPSARLVASAFGDELQTQMGLAEMVGWVDLAHTLCLAESGAIPKSAARELIPALIDLQSPTDFAPHPELGDLYTNREAWLADRTSAVGWLGVARARREALTTAFHLKLCHALCALGEALAAMIDALSAASLRHKSSLMPDYTYLQAAQPTTFGHYLQSFAWPLLRDIERAMALHAHVDQCPAGIGSSNGSTIPQDRWALARRLGFPAPARHARDAMWMQDLSLDAGAIAAGAAITLSRLSEDLMIFASAEYGFVRLADRHSRASKIMPQKRNPFALAYIRGIANRLIGVQAGISAAGRTPSGQMDNRLYVYDAAPDALDSASEAALLAAECVCGLSFDEARAAQALADRSVCASDLAERLTLEARIDFRTAHGAVGLLVTQLEAQGRRLAEAAPEDLSAALQSSGVRLDPERTGTILLSALTLENCVAARQGYGCAAPSEVAAMAEELMVATQRQRDKIAGAKAHRKAAIEALFTEARAFSAGAV